MAGRAGRGGRGCSPPVSIPHGRRCCTLGASPAPRRGRREGCGRARPALVCIADRARRFCAVRRLIEEWPRIEGRAIEGPGMRHKGQRNEERPCSTALLHRAARARRRGLFAKVYRRHADRAVLRPSSGCRHRATSTAQRIPHTLLGSIGLLVNRALLGSVYRITCKPHSFRQTRRDSCRLRLLPRDVILQPNPKTETTHTQNVHSKYSVQSQDP